MTQIGPIVRRNARQIIIEIGPILQTIALDLSEQRLRRKTASFMRKQKTLLHLFLVAGLFLYLYSPLLDHWLGNESYARPHNHTHVSNEVTSQFAPHHDNDSLDHAIDQAHHEEGFLCSLDFDAHLALLLAFNVAPQASLVQHFSLFFELAPTYVPVSIIHLASLDPPPNI